MSSMQKYGTDSPNLFLIIPAWETNISGPPGDISRLPGTGETFWKVSKLLQLNFSRRLGMYYSIEGDSRNCKIICDPVPPADIQREIRISQNAFVGSFNTLRRKAGHRCLTWSLDHISWCEFSCTFRDITRGLRNVAVEILEKRGHKPNNEGK